MADWKPIDDTVKDGRVVVVLFVGTGGPEPVAARWDFHNGRWWWLATLDGEAINPDFVSHYHELDALPEIANQEDTDNE